MKVSGGLVPPQMEPRSGCQPAIASRKTRSLQDIGAQDRRYCLALLLLAFLLYIPPLWRGETLFLRDINIHLQPLTVFWRDSLLNNEFPIWNPLLGTGMPLIASMELPFYYPPFIVFYFLAYDRALFLLLGLHEMLMAVGTYALCRRWGWRPAGALVSALSFVLSGPVLSLHNLYTYTPPVALLPLVILLFLRTWERPSPGKALQLSLLFTLQVATARPDISLMTALFLIVLSIHALRRTPARGLCVGANFLLQEPTAPEICSMRRIALVWGGLTAGVATLGLPILGPTLEMIPLSNRYLGVGLPESWAVSFSPLQAMTLLLPHLFSDTLSYTPSQADLSLAFIYRPYLLTVYLGVLPLLLGAIGMVQRRSPARLLLFLTVLTLLVALGHWTPVYGWFHRWVPLVSFTRFPVKYFILTGYCWSLLAGMGWDRLQERAGSQGRMVAWAMTILPVFLLALYGQAHPGPIQQWIDTLYPWWVGVPSAHPGPIFSGARELVEQDLAWLVLFWTCSVAVIVFSLGRRWAPGTRLCLASGLLVLDLVSVNLPFDPRIGREFLTTPPPLAQTLTAAHDNSRLYYPLGMATYPVNLLQQGPGSKATAIRENIIERRLMLFNIPIAFGRAHCDVYGNMILDNPALLIQTLKDRPGRLSARREMKIAGIFNAATIILPLGGTAPTLKEEALALGKKYGVELQQILLADGVAVFRNPLARPRAYFVPDARVMTSPGTLLAALGSPEQDLQHTVLLEEGAALRETLQRRASARRRMPGGPRPGCEVVLPGTTRVEVLCHQPVSGFLVLADFLYPGWQVFVDGRRWPLLRANSLGRSVYLEAGEHRVEFRYRPAWFLWSWAAALVGMILGLGLIAFLRGDRGPPSKYESA